MFDALHAKGYAATTITDIADRSGVSRRTFYQQFTGKEDCYLAAFDAVLPVVISAIDDSIERSTGDWRARIDASLHAFIDVLVAEPAAAWALLVESLGAGPAISARRVQMLAAFAGRVRGAYRLAQQDDPALPELSPEMFDLLVGGYDDRVRHCMTTRSISELPSVTPLLVYATRRVFGDPM
ncbi:TetR/AcrR family transcriptional regulator [Nocardia brasiliensis]|uniref:TetR/AcrR family transcriptional regulator n=1 Tax=Nocardia brasiliensis TaxID=37326 RepID=UPI001894F256|nr:TetR/AcrR family transcriptional regulator [Nocardia brasiliensis]MBF6547041.1 TetR/AcrR family transcriptional regulator [Nocardia brasiliensis]